MVAAARYSNVLDYAGPNVASNQLIVYTPNGPPTDHRDQVPATPTPSRPLLQAMTGSVDALGTELGAQHVVGLDTTSATLNPTGPGARGRVPSTSPRPPCSRPSASTRRPSNQRRPPQHALRAPGVSNLQLVYGHYFERRRGGDHAQWTTSPPGPVRLDRQRVRAPRLAVSRRLRLDNPVIQDIGSLPSGTSAPNTVLTEHAVRRLGLQPIPAGWLVHRRRRSPRPRCNARQAAAAAGPHIETKNSLPTSAEISNWATVFGIVLALGVLAMSVGLIRSETAGDLRTLTATGASAFTRRS